MTNGIIVARDGYSVENATILQQVFNSGLNTLKVLSTGTLSSTASGPRTVSYDPQVSYQVAFLAWFEVSNSGSWFANDQIEHLSGANCWMQAYVDSSNVFKANLDSDSSKAIVVKYVLLVDPGS